MTFTVVIPMFNEISTVDGTARALHAAAEEICRTSGDRAELIFSCDGSTDGSYDAVPTELSDGYVRIKKVRSEVNRGKGAAVRRGVESSSGDVVIYTDCDLAYGTEVIGELLDMYRKTGKKVIVGSRAIHPDGYGGYSLFRRIASRAYLKVLSVFGGLSLSDSQCGLKLLEGDLARRVFSEARCDGWAFDYEIIMLSERAGADFGELPVKIINHRESRIHMLRDSIKMLREIRSIRKRIKRSQA